MHHCIRCICCTTGSPGHCRHRLVVRLVLQTCRFACSLSYKNYRCPLQSLQTEVNELKRKEAELRALLSEVAGSAAKSQAARLGPTAGLEQPAGDSLALVEELTFVQDAKQFAQCLQVAAAAGPRLQVNIRSRAADHCISMHIPMTVATGCRSSWGC